MVSKRQVRQRQRQRQGGARRAVREVQFAHPDGPSVHVQVIRVSDLRRRKMAESIYDQTLRTFHVLQFVLEGSGAHFVDFERVKLRRGDVLHVHPKQVHAFDRASSHEALMVVFLPEALSQPMPVGLTRPHRPGALRPKPKDFSLLVDLVLALEDLPSRGHRIRAQELGPYLLGAIVAATEQVADAKAAQDSSVPSRTSQLVRAFEQLLEDNLVHQHGVAWYADQLGVSTRTLARACDTAIGTKPKRHIDARLGLEAKRRLMFSRERVEDLSSALGFSEPTNFVKFFRRVVGGTPLEFQRQMLKRGRLAGES